MSQKKLSVTSKVVTSLQEYIDEYVLALTDAITDGLNEQVHLIGSDHARILAMTIVTSLVAAILYKELRVKADGATSRAKEQAVIDHFSQTKDLMQEAVAAGFALSMSKFSGKSVDYYCQVKPVPVSPSKSMN